MYCPKCKENFEEGSRRFCPTDGARLIAQTGGSSDRSEGGVFANLIPRMSGISDLGRLSEAPGVVIARDEPEPESGSDADELFFEFDDPEPESANRGTAPVDGGGGERSVVLQRNLESGGPPDLYPTRKIDPATVPPGGVDLDNHYEPPDIFTDVDEKTPGKLIGKVVKGRYRIVEFLGGDEGGLAFLANDQLAEEKKVLVRFHINDETNEMLESILAEERVSLSHFSHPNVARFIDSGELSNGRTFIISEYIDGLSIGDILSIHGRLEPNRAMRVVRQISSALNEAHQEGILHRDVRPENLVIDPDGGNVEQAKLVNFGASNGELNAGNLVYKSPEVIDGRISTAVSDIFSLAVVSYEMLTGKVPFDGESKTELLRGHYSGPSRVPDDLPPTVNEVFDRALSFKPADRYRKAREFADALSAALEQSTENAVVGSTRDPLVPEETPRPNTEDLLRERPSVEKAKPVSATDKVAPSVDPLRSDSSRRTVWLILGAGILALAAALAAAFYFIPNARGWFSQTAGSAVDRQSGNTGSDHAAAAPAESRPLLRNLSHPPGTLVFQNTRQNLKGDLATNFIGFSLYYPKDWKVIGPEPSGTANTRGKFVDMSRSTADGRLQEQMLISYYSSNGTFDADMPKFPHLVRETNETLKKILPGYQTVSESEITLNGGWRAYEVKFQAGGTDAEGEKLIVWGRRLFVPAASQGATIGYEITMLATSHTPEVRGVDEVGVKGELAPILYSFEPSQSY